MSASAFFPVSIYVAYRLGSAPLRSPYSIILANNTAHASVGSAASEGLANGADKRFGLIMQRAMA